METLKTINFIIAVIFFVCYTYQFLYIPVPWLRKEKPHGPAKANRYAVLICARNEQRVIGDLIASLRGQTYDQSLLSIFVLADNCTDDTAMVARVAGAHVYERFNQVRVGKGYALQELLEHLEQDYPQGFDGYFVFDADNILAPNYVEAMNRTFSDGHEIVTSFRQSWNQRLRWSKGYLQVFRGYGAKLLRGAAGGSFSCYDMAAAIMPAFVLSAAAIVCNVTAAVLGAIRGADLTIALWSVGQMLLNMYLTLFVLGAITTVTEWRRIHTKAVKKVIYAFTFPLFMFTYIPISFAALFSKGEWKPIEHRVSAASLRGRGREELLPF